MWERHPPVIERLSEIGKFRISCPSVLRLPSGGMIRCTWSAEVMGLEEAQRVATEHALSPHG